MTSFEFDCPHCSGRFELENPPVGGYVACPLCGQPLTIPTQLPQVEPTDEGAPGVPTDVDSQAPALDFGQLAPPPERSRRRRSGPHGDDAAYEPLSRAQKERRRQIRSLAWMIGGALLLIIAVAVLSRL